MRPVGQRWTALEIARALEDMEGLLVTPVTQQAVDAAAQAQCVAVLTNLKLEYAQDIAFRRASASYAERPLVIDMAGAFRGFPELEFGLDSFKT